MKKFVVLFLALLLTLSLVACSGEPTPGTNNETKPSQSESNHSTDTTESTENTEGTESTESTESNEISFTEVVAVENTECLIKITGVEIDRIWGFTLKVYLENKSADKTYMFSVESAAINGVVCDPFFASEVAAGKKANDEISFSTDELEENGVGDFTDIELTFYVYDSDDWSADAVAEETIHIYPYGEDKAVQFVREAQESDNVIIDNEYVTVIVTGYENDDIWGYSVKLFLVNKTDKNVMFSVDEVSVNGYMADPFYATSVPAGKCAFSSISWFTSTFEENGITNVEEIEFLFRAYDMDNWMDDDFVSETITLIP